MTEQILTLCRAMGAGQEELLLPLAQAAESRLAGRLKGGTAPEDCGPAFPLAAAMLVMDGLSGMTGGGETASFTAAGRAAGAARARACPPGRRGCWPPGSGMAGLYFRGWRDDGPDVG